MHQQLDVAGPPVGDEVALVRLRRVERLHRAGVQPLSACARVDEFGGQPQRVDADQLCAPMHCSNQPAPLTIKRYHGSATHSATRVGRDAGQIAGVVISHLSGLVNGEVTVRIKIEARLPGDAPYMVVRTVL